jgi:hypothetical protein
MRLVERACHRSVVVHLVRVPRSTGVGYFGVAVVILLDFRCWIVKSLCIHHALV